MISIQRDRKNPASEEPATDYRISYRPTASSPHEISSIVDPSVDNCVEVYIYYCPYQTKASKTMFRESSKEARMRLKLQTTERFSSQDWAIVQRHIPPS